MWAYIEKLRYFKSHIVNSKLYKNYSQWLNLLSNESSDAGNYGRMHALSCMRDVQILATLITLFWA